MPHQEAALRYASRISNPAFFMEMRLGKTLTTIRWIQSLPPSESRAIIVICPLSVMEAWIKELSLEGETFILGSGPQRMEAIKAVWFTPPGQRQWLIINYEAILATAPKHTIRQNLAEREIREVPPWMLLQWDVVVCDESTRLKNPIAKITQLCCKGFRKAKHRAILSGLPSPEGELDLYCQMQFLHNVFLNCWNYWKFRNNHFKQYGVGGWEPKPGAANLIKKAVHSIAFVMRRKQAGLGEKKIYSQRYVSMSTAQRKLYTEAFNDYAVSLQSGEKRETEWILTRHTWLSRIAGGFDPDGNLISGGDGKSQELIALLSKSGELYGEKVVVLYRFIAELDYDAKALDKHKLANLAVKGDTAPELRSSRFAQFRDPRGPKILLVMEKVAKFGIDLSVASTIIYRSNEWSCETRAQSEDRIIHPMKKEPLLYIDLITRGSIDEHVCEVVREKVFDSQAFMVRLDKLIVSSLPKGKR